MYRVLRHCVGGISLKSLLTVECDEEQTSRFRELIHFMSISASQEGSELRAKQIETLNAMVASLAKKAGLRKIPGLNISGKERFASVNVFSFHVTVGENLLSLWAEGKFSKNDVKATIAHEIGHLMDYRRGSGSSSFRNLILESAWFSCGLVPLVVCILFPSAIVFQLSVGFTFGWLASIPLLIRRVERRIEFEADRYAALYLVRPKHLANALTKIKILDSSVKSFVPSASIRGIAGRLTHPSFDDRINRLNGLSNFAVTLIRLWKSRVSWS